MSIEDRDVFVYEYFLACQCVGRVNGACVGFGRVCIYFRNTGRCVVLYFQVHAIL